EIVTPMGGAASARLRVLMGGKDTGFGVDGLRRNPECRTPRAWRDHPTPGGAQRRHFPPVSVPADTRRDKESPGHSDRGSRVIYGVIWRKNELTPQTPRYYPRAQIRQGAKRVSIPTARRRGAALTLAEGSWDINSTRALSSPHVVLQREVNHEARSVRYR